MSGHAPTHGRIGTRPAPRGGVAASRVGLPPGDWVRLVDFLAERLAAVGAGEWTARLARGDVLDAWHRPVGADARYDPGGWLWYWRDVPGEDIWPAQDAETIVFEDEELLVADKPAFMTVTPAGGHLRNSLMLRLIARTGALDLVPLHRIDRETTGLVVFGKRPASRDAYHALFRQRRVRKEYEAIAPHADALHFPLIRRSVIQDDPAHFMRMVERDDVAALPEVFGYAETRMEMLESLGRWARYRLEPLTGRRHQLRVHLAALGLPIAGDRIYPTLLPEGTDDASSPLRLLARSIGFIDPLTGGERRFDSIRTLDFPA